MFRNLKCRTFGVMGLLLLAYVGEGRVAVLTFDGIAVSNAAVPNGYGGFSWSSNWVVWSDVDYASAYGNTYGSPSGDFAAFNDTGALTMGLTNGTDFDFNGAYFTGWAENDSFAQFTATSITVEGYNNGSLVGTAAMALSATQYDFLTANILGVDELRFISSASGDFWLMDDFTYDVPDVPVPVPAGAWLLGSSLLGLLGLTRCRRGKSIPSGRGPVSENVSNL